MQATKSFSPLGVEQLYQMILEGFFNEGEQGGIGIFRCVPNFVLQFGIHGVSCLLFKFLLDVSWCVRTTTCMPRLI